jgi:hypothetical protein
MFRLGPLVVTSGISALLCIPAGAQYMGGTAGSTTAASQVFNTKEHISFDRPEAWGLKYFGSISLLGGLPAPALPEAAHFGSVSLGVELDWLPQLNPGQQFIGFNGTAPEDLNKAPIFARPVLRVGLPDKFTAVVAPTPPMELFGVHSRLVALALERPLIERGNWTLGWRGYGQVGSITGAFTCPTGVLPFPPGSPQNLTNCVYQSQDRAILHYAGSEFEFSYRLPHHPKLIPHAAVAGTFMDLAFQTHAPVAAGLDETRLWTRGGTFATSGGITYLFSKRVAFTVDAFYSPLWVTRAAGSPRTNDGLFNVRALLSYSFR